MLLGHWYLVQPGMPRKLLNELTTAVIWTWPLEVAVLLLPTGMVSVLNGTIDDGWGSAAPHPDDDSVGVILVAPFDTPWRVFSLGADAASVLNSNLPQRLSNLETHPDTSGWPHVAWTKLQADMTGTLAGITAKGVVVDTPVRDDQEMLTFYKTASDAAARRQLGIEFTGRRRTGTLTLRGDSLEIRK